MTDPPAGPRLSPEDVLLSSYLTAHDLDPFVPGMDYALDRLRSVALERALDWVGRMLASTALGDADRRHEREQAASWFADNPAGRRARDLVLSGQRRLFAPHLVLRLGRLALAHCPDRDPAADTPEQVSAAEAALRTALLVLGHHVGAAGRARDDLLRGPNGRLVLEGSVVTDVEVAVAANVLANRRPFPMSAFDRSERRWIEIPAEQAGQAGHVDLEAAYLSATGVPLGDLRMVALVLWGRTLGTSPRVGPGYLDALGLGAARTEAVLGLLAASTAELAAAEARAASATPAAGLDVDDEYDSSLFGERPVVRLRDGGLLVISPVLLVERALGWLPRWDLVNGLEAQGTGGRKRARRADGYLRRTTEAHTVDLIRHLARTGDPPGVVYGEREVQAAYRTVDRNADIAVDWPGAWVVVEVSSRAVGRGTATGASARDLIDEVAKGVISKAEQLDGTIRALRKDESRLTGEPPRLGRRYWPVLVTTEGFPVTRLMTARVRAMLRDAGLLQQPDTAQLVILDDEALEAAESVALAGGPTLPALLAGHAVSDLARDGFREWLLLGSGQAGPLRPPDRVADRWGRVLQPVLDALEQHETSPGP